MTIRKKMILWVLIPLVLIATVTASICYYYTRNTIEQNVFDQLEIAADELQERLQAYLEGKKGRNIDFSSDGFIRDCAEEINRKEDKVEYYISALTNHLVVNKKPLVRDILEVFIVDFNGNIISSSEISQIGKEVSNEVYFSRTMREGSCITDLHYSPEFKQYTFEVARLLSNKKNQAQIGIIVNRHKGNSLIEVTRAGGSGKVRKGEQLGGMGETGELYIVNGDGLMITESRFIKGAVLNLVVDTEGVRTAFDNGTGMVGMYYDYRGIPVLGVSRYIEEMDWVVIAEKDVAEAFVPLVRLRNFTIVMGIIGIVVIVAIAIFISAEITRPIKKLIAGTKRIAGGDLKHPIVVIGRRKDEMKVLGESFNLMMDKLRISNEENARLLLEIEKKGKDEWYKTFDAITDIITIHDKDYRIVRANKAFFEKFNIGVEELSNRKCYEIFHGTGEPWPTCPHTKTADSLNPEYVEVDDPCMGGSFTVSTYPILDEKGKFCAAVHQTKDVTEWKKAEEATRRGKEYTENLIETAQDAIICIDENKIVNIWNQAAYKVFGYKENEIIGHSIKNIISVNILDRFLEMSKILSISKVLEISGKTKDGTMLPIEMSISSTKIEKGQYTFTIIIRDVTFQREAKKQLVEKANMLATINRELEEFVYIVSHDLKEPLFVIEGYTSRLYRAYKDIYSDKEKHYIDRIRTNVKKMAQKIQEIMDVLKAGRITYNFRRNDSSVIIREVINSLEGRLMAENINVIIEPDLPVVSCDETRMKDVFSNLVTNAIKFMGNDKQTESLLNSPRSLAQPGNAMAEDGEFRRIRIGCRKNGDYYKFFVEDTGIGIREEYQEQIFKIFKRLQDIESEGTGVGLAIVKKIVEMHKGKIWVESPLKSGRGSRFWFTLLLEKKTSGKHDMQGDDGLPSGTAPGDCREAAFENATEMSVGQLTN